MDAISSGSASNRPGLSNDYLMGSILRHLAMLRGGEAMLTASSDPAMVADLLRLVIQHSETTAWEARALLGRVTPGVPGASSDVEGGGR
ncbi:hypothetical protein [Streptomyces mayteni]